MSALSVKVFTMKPWKMRRDAAAITEAVTLEAARLPADRQDRSRAPMTPGILTPFSDQSALQAIVWADVTGTTANLLTRDVAMTVPALARQRHLLCGTTARCPLVIMTGADRVATTDATWNTRTDGELSPYHRMLWTIDDLLFSGWSLWRAYRGVRQSGARLGPLRDADRIPLARWETDDADRIMVDGEYAADGDVILIPGPHEGILNFGADALRRTLDNLESAATAARNPSASVELHYTGDDPDPAWGPAMVKAWVEARKGLNGGVAWSNKWVEVKEHGTHESHLLIEGRNADAVDVSRMVSSPASMADATNAGASLTYETSEGRNEQFIDYGVGLYMDAVAARLSMDDVVPRGQRVAFDVEQLTVKNPAPTGAPTPD